MSFPKSRLVGASDCMSWNLPVLRNSAGHLVSESLSLGCSWSLENLPVGVQTWDLLCIQCPFLTMHNSPLCGKNVTFSVVVSNLNKSVVKPYLLDA